MVAPHDFFDLSRFADADLFADVGSVWDALKHLPDYVARAFNLSPEQLSADPDRARALIKVSPGALVEDGAIVLGPALIGPGSRVYPADHIIKVEARVRVVPRR